MTTTMTFVIPTRNRAELAQAAVDGLLAESSDLRVLVSDNSTDEGQAELLARSCRDRNDARLTYLRAPTLPMPAHWDWALRRALEQSDSTHFTIHYDRCVPKIGRTGLLLETLERHPEHVISYGIDRVMYESPRYRVLQPPCSGGLHAVDTASVVQKVAQGDVEKMGYAFPFLSNCAVPRQTLAAINDRFGDFCDSHGPDGAFLFRFCALEREYLHLDEALLVAYASYRSNATGYFSGKTTDYEDFKASWGDRPWSDAVRLPGLDLGWNLIFHEYEVVRREIGDAFPPISRPGYLGGLAWGLRFIADDARRAEMEAVLVQNGWDPPERTPEPPPALSPSLPARLRRQSPVGIRTSLRTARGWLARQLVLLRARALGVQPAHISGYRFGSERRALFYAKRISRVPEPGRAELAWIGEHAK